MALHRSAATTAVRRRPKRSAGHRAGPVTTTHVHPDAWQVAMELADRDRRRIEVVSVDEVIVHNRPVGVWP